jgi:CBS domain-containing protein
MRWLIVQRTPEHCSPGLLGASLIGTARNLLSRAFLNHGRTPAMTIAAILKHKGHDVASVHPDTTIGQLARDLSERRIGAVVVLDAANRLLGIISERDIVRTLAAHGAATLDMTAGQLMTREVRTITQQFTVNEAMTLMTAGRFRHLPVVEGGALVGIVSIGDVVKARIMQQEQEVDSLKAYVAGA